jgi:hypothetical protein
MGDGASANESQVSACGVSLDGDARCAPRDAILLSTRLFLSVRALLVLSAGAAIGGVFLSHELTLQQSNSRRRGACLHLPSLVLLCLVQLLHFLQQTGC